MMNMILSVIVCFAMIFSGTGSLPAVPETAVTWTIRNITIDNGEESVTLSPEARITTAIGAEEAALHFEIGSGEQTLMPASGKISADGVQFELGGTGRSYSISEDVLAEMAAMDEEDKQLLVTFADFFRNYGVLLGKSIGDAQFSAQFNEVAMKALLETSGTSTETEIEIDGEIYPAQEIQLELTGENTIKMMDSLRSCGLAEVEAMFESCLEMVSIAEGTEVSSFADLFNEMDADVSIPMNMVIAQQEGFAYEEVTMEMTEPETGMAMIVGAEEITRGEETELSMTMSMGDDSTVMLYEIQGNMTGPMEAPTAMYLECGVYMGSGYTYPAEAEGEEDYIYNSETSMSIIMEGATENDLETMQVSAMLESYSESGYGEDLETTEESFGLNAACSEALEEDGSVTAAWSFGTDIAGQPWSVSFDINRAEGEAVDYFANAADYALTIENMNGDGENVSEELTMLSMDAMGYVAGAYALTMDESVMDLVNMFTAVAEDYVVETEASVEEVTDEYEDYEEEYEEASVVSSFEEAAEIFDGEIPKYTAPEGYTPSQITVDSFSLDTIYVNEAGESFEFIAYQQYSYGDMSYHLLQDGVMSPLNGYIVELNEYDGLVDSASIYDEDGSMFFYFGGMEMADAQAILAGLK